MRSTITFVASDTSASIHCILICCWFSSFVRIQILFFFVSILYFDDFRMKLKKNQVKNKLTFTFNGTFDVKFHFTLCTNLSSRHHAIPLIFEGHNYYYIRCTQSLNKPIDWIIKKKIIRSIINCTLHIKNEYFCLWRATIYIKFIICCTFMIFNTFSEILNFRIIIIYYKLNQLKFD